MRINTYSLNIGFIFKQVVKKETEYMFYNQTCDKKKETAILRLRFRFELNNLV